MAVGYIYGLIDPRDQIIRYIGKTERSLKKRLDEHIKGGRSRWIRNLLKQEIRPQAVIIETIHSDSLDVSLNCAEVFWIADFKRFGNLLNRTLGGEGVGSGPDHPFFGMKQTDDARRKNF